METVDNPEPVVAPARSVVVGTRQGGRTWIGSAADPLLTTLGGGPSRERAMTYIDTATFLQTDVVEASTGVIEVDLLITWVRDPGVDEDIVRREIIADVELLEPIS